MSDNLLILLLVGLNILQGAFIIWSSHRFVNKAMSRNYYEYEQAKQYVPTVRQKMQYTEQENDELAVI